MHRLFPLLVITAAVSLTTGAAAVSMATRPVTRCPIDVVVGGPPPPGPQRVAVSGPTAIARLVNGYYGGGILLAGPVGWRCAGFISGDGGEAVAIWPRGERGAAFGTRIDPWPRPLAVTATVVPGCTGCKADIACPFFPADAAKYGFPCKKRIPPREKVTRLSRVAVLYEDPPSVHGTSSYSGGARSVFGAVVSIRDTPTKPGIAASATCALRGRSQAICRTILRTFVKSLAG